jgi:hypothetical protein
MRRSGRRTTSLSIHIPLSEVCACKTTAMLFCTVRSGNHAQGKK